MAIEPDALLLIAAEAKTDEGIVMSTEVDEIVEFLEYYDSGMATRAEAVQAVIDRSLQVDLAQLWRLLPTWAVEDICLYVEADRDTDPNAETIDLSFGALPDFEKALTRIAVWLGTR